MNKSLSIKNIFTFLSIFIFIGIVSTTLAHAGVIQNIKYFLFGEQTTPTVITTPITNNNTYNTQPPVVNPPSNSGISENDLYLALTKISRLPDNIISQLRGPQGPKGDTGAKGSSGLSTYSNTGASTTTPPVTNVYNTYTSSGGGGSGSSGPWKKRRDNIYYNDGNVGIGITNPLDKLSVSGDVSITGDYENLENETYSEATFSPTHDTWGVDGDISFVGDIPTFVGSGDWGGDIFQEPENLAIPMVENAPYRFEWTLQNVTAGDIACEVWGDNLLGSLPVVDGTNHLDFIFLNGYPPYVYCSGGTGGFEVTKMSLKQAGPGGNLSVGNAIDVAGAGSIGGNLQIDNDLTVGGSANLNTLEFGSARAIFGQRQFKINELSDVLFRANRRFTVTNGYDDYFDGSFESYHSLTADATTVININMADQSGVPNSGITYTQGSIYVSFYYEWNKYDAISIRWKDRDDVWHDLDTPTDISTDDFGDNKVLKFDIPHSNYLTDIELSVTTNATDEVAITSINYLLDRFQEAETESPYVSKYGLSNYLFGDFGVKTDAGDVNNLLSGTGNSYLAVETGNVGIGTSTPNAKLQIEGSDPSLILSNNALNTGTDSLYFSHTPSSYAGAKGGAAIITKSIGSWGEANMYFALQNSGTGVDATYLDSKMTILNTGFVGIGNIDPSVALDVTGDIEYTGTITDVSDRRLKDNIQDYTGALDIISNLQAKSYNMISTPDKSEVGFIAQDVKSIFPNATSIIDPTKGYLGVSYVSLVPVIAQAVKELNLKLIDINKIEEPNSIREAIVSWFGSASNGILDFFAGRVHTKELCVAKADGSEFCANGDQLEQAVSQGGVIINPNPDPTPASDPSLKPDPTPTPDPVPEVTPPSDPAPDVVPPTEPAPENTPSLTPDLETITQ